MIGNMMKVCLSLFILLLTCLCDVYTSCSDGDSLSPVTRGFFYTGSKQYPSAQFVFETYFKGSLWFYDKCISRWVINRYKIESSKNELSHDGRFERVFFGPKGIVNIIKGKYFISESESSNSYMSFTANGGPMGKPKEYMEGRIYILRIEPPPRYNYEITSWTADKEEKYGGSVLTYYRCLTTDTSNIAYVVQTKVKNYTIRAGKNLRNSMNLETLYIPDSGKPLGCYYW